MEIVVTKMSLTYASDGESLPLSPVKRSCIAFEMGLSITFATKEY